MYKTLQHRPTDAIFTITINRPDKLNALNTQVMTSWSEAVTNIYQRGHQQRHHTGAGTKAFVAGADISNSRGLQRRRPGPCRKGQDIFMRIAASSKPIAAAVNGFALGGGCELAMAVISGCVRHTRVLGSRKSTWG